MNKTQRFIVEIVLSDKITDDVQIDEVAQNIANGIVRQAEVNLAPENSDTYTKTVYVRGWYSDKQIVEHIG